MSMKVNVGDTIKFGSYPQDEYGKTVSPIEWKVLAVKDGKALVLSVKGLDMVRYNDRYVDTTWKDSQLRAWLNDEFFNKAFTADEQAKILETKLKNPANATYGTPGCEDTVDKLFALSTPEIKKYFPKQADRKTVPTDYAKKQGAYYYTETGYCIYWLRTPGYTPYANSRVNVGGGISELIYDDERPHRAARPAMWIEL